MQDPKTASERLSELRALGVGIGIDDFGTGYSSLSYLHRLPLTVLKIDRTFVWAMGPNARETKICHTIVALAKDLGLTVVAEGIETEEQRQRLQNLHCEFGQGYLFAKPLPAKEATELVRSGRSW
jgi:EAL domain-containing protein (putative c-di-GMP-specific phosphodiesterase class I)